MELDNIKLQTTWNDAAASINSNTQKIGTEIDKLKASTYKNKGYFKTLTDLQGACPTASLGSKAYVGSSYPYAIYLWNGSAWEDSGEKGGEENLDLLNYYTKEDVNAIVNAVNEALGTKFGALYVDATTGIMSVFATESDKAEWLATQDSSLVITSVNVGVSGGGGTGVTALSALSDVSLSNLVDGHSLVWDEAMQKWTNKKVEGGGGGTGTTSYQLSLKSSVDTTKTYSTTDTNAFIDFYFIAKQKAPDSDLWEEMTGESVAYTIEIATGGSAFSQISQGYLLSGASAKYDVRKYLVAGSSTLIRVRATGDLTGLNATLTYNYSLTSMSIAPADFTWYRPFIEGNSYSLGGLTITGNLEKTLYVKVSSTALAYTKVYTKALGTQTWVATPFSFTEMLFPTAGTGVYDVEIWLDADGLESEHLKYKIMCVASKDQYSVQLVTMTNIASEAVNYADNKLFSYAIYNRGAATGDPFVMLSKTEGGSTSTFYSDTLEGVTTAAAHDFTTSIEISSVSSDVSISALLRYGNEQTAKFSLDNSASFPATSGATFHMNPASRSNSQTNYLRVINEVTGSSVAASWSNMAWTDGTDGWTIDNEGRKCLRLPATTRCEITGLQPMASFGNSKTLEFTFKAENASDYNEPVVTICDNAANENFRGIKILPDKIIVHSRDEQNDLVQSYPFQDEKTIHLVVTLQKNYKVTYGNLCKIYANGVGICSFAFNGSDNWTNNGYLTLGSNTADLYVYGFRQYESGFGASDAFRNFLASLPDLTTKRAENTDYYKVLNDNEVIDYDVIKGTENTMVIEMLGGDELPQYGFDKDYEAQCNMWLNILNEIEGIDPQGRILTGEYLDQTITGQGTTSMNYYRWNLRWKMDDDYDIRITAKKNYASSMQSHKMGATALYNDVYKKLGLSNGSTGRVAVYQYPVYGFLKRLKEGTADQYYYEFIGLFTVGPDKGDKKTFGFKDKGLKDTLINLEGTDHNPAGVGFDYPWSELKYIEDNEAFGARLSDGTYEKAYEVGNCGVAKTQDAIQAYLDQEFAPAYNIVFDNSTMIIGTTTPLADINANVTAWGLNKDAEGHLYSRYMVWIDGDYTLYYLNKATNKYTSTGINLVTQNGTPSGSTVEEKNEWFKEKRRARFKANVENYWDLQDLLFHDVFLLIIAASDNLKKNFYPQKFKTLADGGRWGFRQDDLDSIFRTDNQAHQTKGYSVEQFDWTDDKKTAYVFKGEDSALHHLLYECFPNEVLQMGNRILDAMASLSDTGTNAIEKLMGCFEKYFFGKAQDYFTKSAYNADAEYSYEDAWPPYNSGEYSVDVHPLEQSLGGNEESERGWIWLRMIYCMSMFRYGTFATYTDTSLGRITYRPQYAQSFTLTPAIDLYPTILPGQGTAVRSAERIKAGDTYTLPAVGGGNTNIYIPASDYIRDIGDLRTLAVDSAAGSMSVAGKRLQRLKLGDVDAGTVTSTLTGLSIGKCPSLTIIDARNVRGLTGNIDLSQCPRIDKAYFGGTAVKGVVVPSGSKITELQLGDGITTITLVNLPKLTSEGFTYENLKDVEYLRIEDVGFNEFTLLRQLYNTEGNALRDIRIVGADSEGTSSDVEMLANIYNDIDKDGNPHPYNGIDDKGDAIEALDPVIDGTLRIDGSVYEDSYQTVSDYFKSLKLIVTGSLYIRFADDEVERVLLANGVGDGVGITEEMADGVTTISTWFKGNTEIESFNELGRFDGVTALVARAFENCTSLRTIDLSNIATLGDTCFSGCTSLSGELHIPNLTRIELASFYQCKNLEKIDLSKVTYLGYESFRGCSSLKSVVSLENVKTLGGRVFQGCTSLADFIHLPQVTVIENTTFASSSIIGMDLPLVSSMPMSFCENCASLKSVNAPLVTTLVSEVFQNCPSLDTINLDFENMTEIGAYSFEGCSALAMDIVVPKLTSLGAYVFRNSGITSFEAERLESIGNETFNNCASLINVQLPNVLTIGSYAFNNCTSLVNLEINTSQITQIGEYAFRSCPISGDWVFPELITVGRTCFIRTLIRSFEAPKLTTLGAFVFQNCIELERVILSNVTSIGQGAFQGATALQAVVIDNVTPPSLVDATFAGANNYSIYVPDSAVDTYKTTANWSSYASRIKPLSEYEG